jgi:glycosyltransferase involved in cell wall biosynthesis
VTETELIKREKEALKSYHWSRIIVPSNYCKSLFGPYANTEEIMVVHHGIHPDLLEDVSDVPKREKFTFLYVFNTSLTGGSLIRKNLGNLLSAFKSFRTQQDCSLLIKSASNIEADVRVIESDNPGVKFDMNIYTPKDLAKLYKSCHAYINVSRAEGFGMTVIEAMACGLPVASPNHSGLGDFVNDSNAIVISSVRSKERFTYATNDGFLWDVPVQDITNAMGVLFRDNERLTERAKQYSQTIKNQYSWQNCLKDFTLWTGLLKT